MSAERWKSIEFFIRYSDFILIPLYMGQCPAKSPLWYIFKISRTSKRKVTLALKCMANYKFSA